MVKKILALILLFSLALSACQIFDLLSAPKSTVNTGGNSSNLNAPVNTGNNSSGSPSGNSSGNSGGNSGNSTVAGAANIAGNTANNPAPVKPTATKTLEPTATATPTNTPTPVPQTFGPDNYPAGMNPLTCESVQDPASLDVPPALISITNFPASARPQAGLAWANWVMEGYIGEGMNRFLAVFHGDFPTSDSGGSMTLPDSATSIGPIRSGRVWYEDWRQLFDGFLVAASGAPQVLAQLGSFNYQFGSDEGDINSALIPIDKLKDIASSNPHHLGADALNGNLCDVNAPANGAAATSFFTFYAPLNQVLWKYEPSLGAYQRYENDTVTGDTFTLMTDRIDSIPLTFENLIIVYTDFQGKDAYFYMNLLYSKGPAQIMRDGKIYNIRWTTEAGEYEKTTGKNRPMRFTYDNGEPFPLKPGQTWVLLAPLWSQNTMHETHATGTYIQLLQQTEPGSGHWAIQIFGPRKSQ
jgi:hypothetical protein